MVRKLTKEQVQFKRGNAEVMAFVEICSPEEFAKVHIPGALNIPPEKLKERVPAYLPNKGLQVVVYSRVPRLYADDPAWAAAEELDRMGYGDVYYLIGGMEEWMAASYGIQSVHFPPKEPEPKPRVGGAAGFVREAA